MVDRSLCKAGRYGELSPRWNLLRFIAFSALILFQEVIFAADSTFTPQLTVREIYTDNIRLSSQDEEDGFLTSVNPGFVYRLRGRRVEVNVDYNLQVILGQKDAATEVFQQYQEDDSVEIVDEHLFFDLRSTFAQTNPTNTEPEDPDNINLTGNRINTFTYSASLYFRERLGSHAEALVRYTFSEVLNEGDEIGSRSHLGKFELASGSRFIRMPWRLAYSRQHIENEDVGIVSGGEDDSNFGRVEGLVRYLFNRQHGVFVRAGVDNNDFQSASDNSGPFWEAGFTWNPSLRTRLEAGYGYAFFGPFVTIFLSHRSRRSLWQLRLEEDVSTTGQSQLDRVLWSPTDEFAAPIIDPLSGPPVRNPTDTATLTAEVFVKRRFEGSVALKGRRTERILEGFGERRKFQSSGQTESVSGISIDLIRKLSPRLSVGNAGRWEGTDFRYGIRKDNRWEGNARITRQFVESVQGSIEYRYTQDNSKDPTAELAENRIMATLTGSC